MLLLTRPLDDSMAMAPLVRQLGWQVMIDPLLDIRYRDAGDVSMRGWQGYLVTSRNGLRALVHARADRRIPVFAVGRGTAALARENGFHSVHDADGNVDDLSAMVRKLADPAGAALLHACGSDLAGNLSEQLSGAGFRVERAVLYRADVATELALQTVRAMTDGLIRAVMVFSPRTAQCLTTLVSDQGLAEHCPPITAIAISERAAGPLRNIPFGNIWVAARPNQDDMLDLLEKLDPVTGGTAS